MHLLQISIISLNSNLFHLLPIFVWYYTILQYSRMLVSIHNKFAQFPYSSYTFWNTPFVLRRPKFRHGRVLLDLSPYNVQILLFTLQEAEIKKMAKSGNKEACKILAKQLVQLRKQKNRTYAVSSKVTSMSTQTKVMNSQMKMAGAMSATAKVRLGAPFFSYGPGAGFKIWNSFR